MNARSLKPLLAWLGSLLLISMALVSSASASSPTGVAQTFFQVPATHGYRVLVSAGRVEGAEGALILVEGHGSNTVYSVRGTIGSEESPSAPDGELVTSIQADLGDLGRIDLKLTPGAASTAKPRCGGPAVTAPGGTYSGTFEFHGEGGYTDAVASSIEPQPQLFANSIGCALETEDLNPKPQLPGARLELEMKAGKGHLVVVVKKNGPHQGVSYSAVLSEMNGRVVIIRERVGTLPAATFTFDPTLTEAEFSPSSSLISGKIEVERGSVAKANGLLEVSFPGKSNVAAAIDGAKAYLMHGRFTTEHKIVPASTPED